MHVSSNSGDSQLLLSQFPFRCNKAGMVLMMTEPVDVGFISPRHKTSVPVS